MTLFYASLLWTNVPQKPRAPDFPQDLHNPRNMEVVLIFRATIGDSEPSRLESGNSCRMHVRGCNSPENVKSAVRNNGF